MEDLVLGPHHVVSLAKGLLALGAFRAKQSGTKEKKVLSKKNIVDAKFQIELNQQRDIFFFFSSLILSGVSFLLYEHSNIDSGPA